MLDGRLDDAERAALLSKIDGSDDDFAVLMDASAAVSALDAAPRIQRSRPWQRHRGAWLAAAAGLAGIALAPWAWSRLQSNSPGDPGRFATLLTSPTEQIVAGRENRPWTTTRGGGAQMTDQARAARIGTYITDVDLAVRMRDSAAARLATELAAVLDEVSGGSPAARAYRDLAANPAIDPKQLKEARDAAAAASPSSSISELAAALEAAKFAAAGKDRGFFEASATQRVLARGAQRSDVDAATLRALGQVVPLATAGGELNWDALTRAIDEAQRALVDHASG